MFLVDLSSSEVLKWVVIIGVGLTFGWLIGSIGKNNNKDKVIKLDPEEFRANMRKGQLIDIRSEEDYKTNKINGSRNFPKKTISHSLSKLRADQAVFLYGNAKSLKVKSVAKKLVKKGFMPVYILNNGFENWPYTKK